MEGQGEGGLKAGGFQKEGNHRDLSTAAKGGAAEGEDSRKTSISFPLTRTVSLIVTEQPY